ncbi:cytochrome P450 9e2-like [Polyergus mexicanus]|uniref:cytochrome P450 9e2-like n=1 Tax=Polyergus mexicanus TaxID=615972 RepID=UPI0038B47389
MVYVIALTVIAGALGLYYYIFKNVNFFKKHGIPYKTPFPILGNMAKTMFRRENVLDLVKNMYNLHLEAKYVGMFDMTTPIVVIRDPDLIKSIALKNFDMFPDHRTFIEEHQDPLFGKNLFSLKGERWRQVRPLLSPAFTSSKMKSMFKLMSSCAIEFSNYLAQMPTEKKMMEMKDAFTRYTNDVIATCAFGISVDSMRNPNNEFYVYGREATTFNSIAFVKMYIFRSLPWIAKIFNLRIIRDKIANFFRDLVEDTIKTRDENGIVRPDMLQLMMETRGKKGKPELSIEDMVSQAFVFFFGGFDSTSTLMCFAAHEIAVNEQIQKKLQHEIDKVLEESNGSAPYEIVNNMEYMDAVISEALRMYPVAPALDRICVKSFELPPTLPGMKPFTIKKGEGIWIPVYGLHQDPQYFEEPEKFDPERFLGERKKESLNCGAYLPFGLGPRMCIGNRFALMETKVLLFHLLARCDLKPCEKTSIPLKISKDGFNMRPEGGFWLNILPRKNIHRTIAINAVNGTSHQL